MTQIISTKLLSENYDCIAPDGSEIRFLQATEQASMVHCTLPEGACTQAVMHRTVEEIWYFLEGSGEVWRKSDENENISAVGPGVSLTIPLGYHFQFRNTGKIPLKFIIATMPPWPGADEAVIIDNHWC
jgi:mannose-6-phosphate isomerase-like protein (cupin superfamily)